jgi:hypothetical protein
MTLVPTKASIQRNSTQWKTRTTLEYELFDIDWLQCFATHILDAKHEFTDFKDVINQLTHLSTH